MKKFIIGIAGELNSGKDTLASMLNYIYSKGVASANFGEWQTKRVNYDIILKHKVTHFADPMKDCLSIMYGIPREYFDDRLYKDELWYCIKQKRFIKEEDTHHDKYQRIDLDGIKLFDNSLNKIIDNIEWNEQIPIIKIRTLMQYFGTEVVRDMMGANIWINATISRAADIAETHGICIIPDIRFINELSAIKGNSLYGQDILIKRDTVKGTEHSSETIDFRCNVTLHNDKTLMTLFYKAVGIINHLLNPVH